MRKIIVFFCVAAYLAQPCAFAARDEIFENGIRTFFAHQQNEKTGLVDSFINTTDELLVNQASTYDNALAGLVFLQLKDYSRAKRILLFLRDRWSDNGLGNFYDTDTGSGGVETTAHLGPNAWVGILALWYGIETGDDSFYPFARDIGIWITTLPRHRGGLAMGPIEDWGGPWPAVVSSENNIVAYALLRGLYDRERYPAVQQRFFDERRGIIRFLQQEIIRRDEKGRLSEISVGYNTSEGVSLVEASDVVTMLMLAFDPRKLRESLRVTERELVYHLDRMFLVTDAGIKGYDFTDKASCDRIKRRRMISLEWTAQAAVAFASICRFYERNPGPDGILANTIDLYSRIRGLAGNIDKKKISTAVMVYYPYATADHAQVFPFGGWWRTPRGEPSRCGAVSSTAWRFFMYRNFNPLDIPGDPTITTENNHAKTN